MLETTNGLFEGLQSFTVSGLTSLQGLGGVETVVQGTSEGNTDELNVEGLGDKGSEVLKHFVYIFFVLVSVFLLWIMSMYFRQKVPISLLFLIL